MKKIKASLIAMLAGLSINAQTVSDSLFNSKLYPLKDGKFLFIGSENPNTYRKSVIRLYDKNLNILKEVKQKKGRSSDIYLDEILPYGLRIIDRYRWNKGRVKIYDDNLELKSSVFFKRDDYKDWQITTDEYPGYPLRGEEHLFGLDPIFLADSFCYYFDQVEKKIIISNYNYSMIKPVFIKKHECNLQDAPDHIYSYKFVKVNNDKVIFYYSSEINSDFQLNFLLLDLTDKDTLTSKTFLMKESRTRFFLSDFSYDEEFGTMLMVGGFIDKLSKKSMDGNKGMDGYFFMRLPVFSTLKNSDVKKVIVYNSVEDSSKIIGYKSALVENDEGKINLLLEKFSYEENNIKLENNSKRNYQVKVYPEKMICTQISDENGEVSDFIKFNFFSDKYKGNEYRILNFYKGQSLRQVMFNGNSTNPYFSSSIKSANFSKGNIVYWDRMYHSFKYNLKTEEFIEVKVKPESIPSPSVTTNFVFQNYLLLFSTMDWGFKLQKVEFE